MLSSGRRPGPDLRGSEWERFWTRRRRIERHDGVDRLWIEILTALASDEYLALEGVGYDGIGMMMMLTIAADEPAVR